MNAQGGSEKKSSFKSMVMSLLMSLMAELQVVFCRACAAGLVMHVVLDAFLAHFSSDAGCVAFVVELMSCGFVLSAGKQDKVCVVGHLFSKKKNSN